MMDEYLELLSDLSIPEDYDPLDRYNDFRKVFLDTDQGRRVLKQILGWGHLLRVSPISNPVDPWRMVFAEGARNLALGIFAVMLKAPPEKPARQTQVEKKE